MPDEGLEVPWVDVPQEEQRSVVAVEKRSCRHDIGGRARGHEERVGLVGRVAVDKGM